MIERFERFTFANSEIARYLRKLSGEVMEKHGLKSAHAIYFTVLERNFKDGLTAKQLCDMCSRDKAEVSRSLAFLEQKGLVIKKGVHQNLYNGVFILTADGKEIANCVKQKAAKAVEIAGKDLTEEQRQIFYSSLASIVENLRILSKEGIPE